MYVPVRSITSHTGELEEGTNQKAAFQAPNNENYVCSMHTSSGTTVIHALFLPFKIGVAEHQGQK